MQAATFGMSFVLALVAVRGETPVQTVGRDDAERQIHDSGASANRAGPRWPVIHEDIVGTRREGWLEVLAGRLVFTVDPERGLHIWDTPLRGLRMRADGKWVAFDPRRGFRRRYLPQNVSPQSIVAIVKQLGADKAVASAGDALAFIEDVRRLNDHVLLASVNNERAWKTVGRVPVSSLPGVAGAGILAPVPPQQSGITWVAADLALTPGTYSLSLVSLMGDPQRTCQVELSVVSGQRYALTQSDDDNVPRVKDRRTGRTISGRCLDLPLDANTAWLEMTNTQVALVDEWNPWITVGGAIYRNPTPGPSGVRWVSAKIALPPGPRRISTAIYRYTGPVPGFLWVAETTTRSLGDCVISLDAERSRTYRLSTTDISKQLGSQERSFSFNSTTTSFRSWGSWASDDFGRRIASCGFVD